MRIPVLPGGLFSPAAALPGTRPRPGARAAPRRGRQTQRKGTGTPRATGMTAVATRAMTRARVTAVTVAGRGRQANPEAIPGPPLTATPSARTGAGRPDPGGA